MPRPTILQPTTAETARGKEAERTRENVLCVDSQQRHVTLWRGQGRASFDLEFADAL
jgi:hypothetical protein